MSSSLLILGLGRITFSLQLGLVGLVSHHIILRRSCSLKHIFFCLLVPPCLICTESTSLQVTQCVPYSCSHVQFFVTLCIVALQTPLSMKFSGKVLEWVAISQPRKSSDPRRLNPHLLASPTLAGGCFTTVAPGKPLSMAVLMFSVRKSVDHTHKPLLLLKGMFWLLLLFYFSVSFAYLGHSKRSIVYLVPSK